MTKTYFEEISTQTMEHIKKAILEYRQGKYSDPMVLPNAIAAILETEIEDPEYQKFAVENYSQIVGIVINKNPKYLAIKSNIERDFYFQVDDEIVEAYQKGVRLKG